MLGLAACGPQSDGDGGPRKALPQSVVNRRAQLCLVDAVDRSVDNPTVGDIRCVAHRRRCFHERSGVDERAACAVAVSFAV